MNKKIFFFSLIFIIILFIWKDYKKIDFHFVNQSKVTYNYKNLNNNFLKTIHRKYQKFIENFLIRYSNKHKLYWELEDENIRSSLPNFKFLEKTKNFTHSNNILEKNFSNWERSHGNNLSNRFSYLQNINHNNAHKLKIAWSFEMENQKNDIQANPIIVEGVIYTPIAGGYIVAIDGYNGKLIWKSKKFGSSVAKRGLVFWKGNDNERPRIIFSNRERLISLDIQNGKKISSFGKDGQIRTGLNFLTPIIYKNNIVIVTWDRAVEIYDISTGKTKWKLKYKKDIKKRYGGKKYNNAGANAWGGISADIERGILYFTTGNPHYYFDGTQRPGDNAGSSSIIAVDLNQKKILWSFQETSHDIWNSDLPAPPILTVLKKNNKLIDVVITPTKRGNSIILDRITGKPIFDFRLRKAPASKLPGEKTSIYQPDLTIPEPFSKNIFKKNDIWSFNEKNFNKLIKKYSLFKYGFYEPHELNKKNLQYNFHGGAEWMGASIDHDNQVMYVTANNIPYETEIVKNNFGESKIPKYESKFKRALDEYGYPISKPPWGTLTALNLNTGKIIWQIPFGEFPGLKEIGIEITGTENFGGVTSTAGNISIATGTLDKKIYVFDSSNGEIIYKETLPFIGSSPPSTYLYKDEQFIIVHSSGGKSLQDGYPNLVTTGNKIIAFKLR